MKRRGFLGALLGLPAAPVAARLASDLDAHFPKKLLESEPPITPFTVSPASGIDWSEYCVSAVVTPYIYEGHPTIFSKVKR